MITEISSLIASTKAAYDIARGISSLKSSFDRNESISRVIDELLTVREQALSMNLRAQELQQENQELKQRIADFEKWTEMEEQYELKEIAPSLFVYSYKVTENFSKPTHWLCPKCFQERKAHIIQCQKISAAGKHYFCPNCNTEYFIQRRD